MGDLLAKNPNGVFRAYAIVLVVLVVLYQRGMVRGDDPRNGAPLPAAGVQRQVTAKKYPPGWYTPARPAHQVRGELAKTTDMLLRLPSKVGPFQEQKKRRALLEASPPGLSNMLTLAGHADRGFAASRAPKPRPVPVSSSRSYSGSSYSHK